MLGNNGYGSSDFDAAISRALAARLAEQGIQVPETRTARRRLEIAAEQLKIELSGREHAELTLRGFAGRDQVSLELSRTDLAAILAELLTTLRETCGRFAETLTEPVQHLVLIGRPMLSPLVCGVIEEVFGLRRTMVSDPRTAVASGAALEAAVLDGSLKDVLLLDVTPLALGLKVMGDDRPEFSTLRGEHHHPGQAGPGVHHNRRWPDRGAHRDFQRRPRVRVENRRFPAGGHCAGAEGDPDYPGDVLHRRQLCLGGDRTRHGDRPVPLGPGHRHHAPVPRRDDQAIAVAETFLPAEGHHDLALLRLAEPVAATLPRLGYAKSVRIGDRVWAASAPAGPVPGDDEAYSLSSGIVDQFESFPEENLLLFKVSLSLPPDCSGGPLLSDLVEVVGVLTITSAQVGTGPTAVFALTADSLTPLLNQHQNR